MDINVVGWWSRYCIGRSSLVPLATLIIKEEDARYGFSEYSAGKEERFKQFMGKLRFYVSDYAVPEPDPFIAVKFSCDRTSRDIIIFDVWDEPGFTGFKG